MSAVPERISDGLGPMARWAEARDLAETLEEILQRVCEGERLKQVCRSKGWPYAVVAKWVAEGEERVKAYEAALRIASDEMALETVEIADGASQEDIAVAKHRTDVRLKLASRLYRERYGEQVQHNVMVDSFGEMLKRVSERKLAALKAAQQQPAITERVVEGEVVGSDAGT